MKPHWTDLSRDWRIKQPISWRSRTRRFLFWTYTEYSALFEIQYIDQNFQVVTKEQWMITDHDTIVRSCYD